MINITKPVNLVKMQETSTETTIFVKQKYSLRKILQNGTVLILALTLGYIHYKYVSTLFENDRNFSHLSELEREMSFRTEMGFYYSYYKTIVQERPFIAAISKLMYDRLVEYPKDVNAFNRFNIHPEVIIGAAYRYLEPWLNTTTYRQCHMVYRGADVSHVESCVGIGHPIMFYLEAVWGLAGLMVAAVFVHATALSESVFGGLLAVAQYFANHSEATRVQWAPNERENFAAPLFFIQTWLVTLQLRDKEKRTSFQLQVTILIINCLCLLFWQFSQFIFLTQIAIFFVMEQLRVIDLKTLCIFLHSHFCGLQMAVLLLQGNDMLKSSLYTSLFLVISIYCLFFATFRIKLRTTFDLFVEVWLSFLRICTVVTAAFYLKHVISDILGVEEDSHIWDILRSKFTNHKTFHTLIYTCSEVFDFLPATSVEGLTKTLLLPIVLCNSVAVVHNWIRTGIQDEKKKKLDVKLKDAKSSNSDTDDSGIENNAESGKKAGKFSVLDDVKKENGDGKELDDFVLLLKQLRVDAAVFYNISQMVVFGIMAVLIMRLKLLFVTQMCIVSSLAVNTRYYPIKSKLMPVVWAVAVAVLCQRAYQNINTELSHIGEFSDLEQEELLEWAATQTSASAVFAGSMPILSAIMLSARRPVVAHPHYEHKEARDRSYTVYKTYGRFTPQHLYQELSKLKATHLVVETKYCYGRSERGCSFESIWDVEEPSRAGRPRLCHRLLTERLDHFYAAFANARYTVLAVHELSVRYMPRCFDT